MITSAILYACATVAVPPRDIRCPDATKSCHLLVDLAAGGRAWPQPFPLGPVRIARDRVWWLDGITFATVSVAPRSDLGQVHNFPLDMPFGSIRAVAVSDKTLLILSADGLHVVAPEGAVRHYLAVHSAWALASDGAHIAWTTGTTGFDLGTVEDMEHGVLAADEFQPGALAVDRDGVYWVSFAVEGTIRALRWGEGSPITLAQRQTAPRAIALDAERIYWLCDTVDGRVVCSVPKGGGEVTETARWPARQGTDGEERLVVCEGSVYWIAGGQLIRARGNEVVALTQGPGRVVSFDVDDRGVMLAMEIPAEP